MKSRRQAWLFIAAFGLIVALDIGDAIDEGFDVWNGLVIAVCVAFLVRAVLFLTNEGAPRT